MRVVAAAVCAAILIMALCVWPLLHGELGLGRRSLAVLTASISTVGQAQLPVPPTRIGANPSYIRYYSNDRQFANLMIGSNWVISQPHVRNAQAPAADVDAEGNLLRLAKGSSAARRLTPPDTGPAGKEFVCTYSGTGKVVVRGDARMLQQSDGKILFRLVQNWEKSSSIWVSIFEMDAARPVRDLDCREANLPRTVRFAPDFIDELKGYKVLRFMDWQNTNKNLAVSWNDRRKPTSSVLGDDGVAIEDMMAVASAVGADPWFCMPWNADPAYIEGFARRVHALLPAGRSVYVELGNEVWNVSFSVAKQAGREGAAEGLDANGGSAQLPRYAERTVEVMRIWERVFADRKGLVRVAATQHVQPKQIARFLGFRDTASHVDAIATAPYFGLGLDPATAAMQDDVDGAFTQLTVALDRSIELARNNKAAAASFKKRYIAYEGGQHVRFKRGKTASKQANAAFMRKIQRDPRMYDLYKKYLRDWKTQIGDVICLLTTVAPIGSAAGFGQREHTGAPLYQSPKQRAVSEEL